MGIAIGFLIVNIILILLFEPIGVNCKSHFSLIRSVLFCEISIFAFKIINVIVSIDDGLKIKINGKIKKSNTNKENIDFWQAIDVIKMLEDDIKISAIALFGVGDAKNSAILCAMIDNLPNVTIYPSNNSQFEMDVNIKSKISIVDALIFIVKSNRRVYGYKQLDK